MSAEQPTAAVPGPQAPSVPVAPVWKELLPDGVPAGEAVPWLAPTALDHLGDPDGERVALLQGQPVLLPRTAAGHLRLTGADRVDFVHGQVSHDVRGLPAGGVVDALLLDHRGQVRAGLSAFRREHDLYLRVDDGRGPTVLRELQEHIIFDQVELEDLSTELAMVSLAAGGEAPLLDLFPQVADELQALAPGRSLRIPHDDASLLARRWSLGPLSGLDLSLLARQLPELWRAWVAAGWRPVGERAWTAGRVAHGLPSALAEGRLGLPQETGLEPWVSYRKGCYLGQEIMARVEARGRLRRGLAGLRLAGPPPALGLSRGWRLQDAAGKPVGELGSAAPAPDGGGWWALAVLKLDHPADQPVELLPEGVGPYLAGERQQAWRRD